MLGGTIGPKGVSTEAPLQVVRPPGLGAAGTQSPTTTWYWPQPIKSL